MSEADRVDIAIIGAGIAGLSTALACQAAGISAQVYEAAPEIRPLGSSLSIWPNAMACLAEWGIADKVRASGALIAGLAWRRLDGRPYFEQDLKGFYDDLGQDGVCIRRADLHSHLMEALQPETLQLDHRVETLEHSDTGVRIRFLDGREVLARQVVGADGLWSKTRAEVLKDGPPKYAGYGAWLMQTKVPAPGHGSHEGCEYIGEKARLGVFETGQGIRYTFVVANAPDPVPHARPADPNECAPLLKGWPEALQRLALESEETVYASFYDRPVAARWGKGAVALIGDAMHPFVPNLGQGACQAIEDAHVLTEGLRQGQRGEDLISWMKTHRLKRLRYMRKSANKVGQLVQSTSPLMRKSIALFGVPPFRQMMRRDLRYQFTRSDPR